MNTQTIVVGLVALIIGALGGHALGPGKEMRNAHTMSMEDMMASMNGELEGKQGDEFDKAFLTEMTAHHRGAIQMAEMALQNAKHAEIKNMAQAIISAQDAEIKQMQKWQAAWYGEPPPVTSGDDVESGSAVHHAQ